ncbi:flavin reductase [Rhizobium sp. KVB221]|uniref:Flavin reductase n=1 Tax=Rhizobium setariae TaxID=2801340 RepID=A0A937CQB6_9HYPH|nr:flavin reductase [Rhizobium setariae]MBL0374244.1 flavin reductase [Rhizobium setariae]
MGEMQSAAGFQTAMNDGAAMVDKFKYREAMSKLGAAVSVVTSNGEAGLCGATVSAVCSVTDTPATLLVCVNQSSRSNSVIKANRVLCVNVLAGLNRTVADLFAGSTGVPSDERFSHVSHSILKTGAPVLDEAIVSFDCELDQVIEFGTHSIFLARVVDIRGNNAEECLVYFGRQYISVGALPE